MMLSQVFLDLWVQNSSGRIALIVVVCVRDTGHYCGVCLGRMVVKLEVRVPILVHNHLVQS